jgi:predicted nucleotide-binding protein
MNIDSLIQECIEDIDTKRRPLSHIIIKCIRIAAYADDYTSWLWLKMELNSTTDKRSNVNFADEMENLYISKGFSKDEFKAHYNNCIENYIARRSFPKLNIKTNQFEDMINSSSISEIELSIENINLRLSKNVVPNGLHTVDIYYADKEKQKYDLILMTDLDGLKKIIDRTNTKVYEFLINIERKVAKENIKTSKVIINKNIFIIHGHDEAKWRELEKLLKHDFGLNPFILSELPDLGKTIIEKFEHYANECCYAFAIFTPDDIIENNGIKYFQARPNVIFELGWFCSFLGRDKVCILFKEGANTSIFSDFQGVIQKRFSNSISEVYRDIKLELNSAGIY